MSHLQNTDLTIKYLDLASNGVVDVKAKLREIQARSADDDLTPEQEAVKQAHVDALFNSLRDELVPVITSIRDSDVPLGADLQPFVEAPTLTGLTEAEAITTLDNAGFPSPTIRNKDNADETDGLVYLQTPEAGIDVDGTTIFYIEVAVNPV